MHLKCLFSSFQAAENLGTLELALKILMRQEGKSYIHHLPENSAFLGN